MHAHGWLQSSGVARKSQENPKWRAGRSPLNRRGGRALAALAGLAGLTVAFPAGAASGGDLPAGGPAVVDAGRVDTVNWSDALLTILRDLIIVLGGNPDELDERLGPETNMNIVVDRYYAVGVPADLGAAERSEALADVNTADGLAAQSPDAVDRAAVGRFRTMLSDFRYKLTLPAPQPPTPRGM